MKHRIYILLLFLLSSLQSFAKDTIALALHEAIRLGVSHSVDAAVAQNEYTSAYWGFKTYKTELLPEVSFNGTLPYYSRSYNMYQNNDGTYKYVSNHYTRLDGGLSITQNLPWTGGQLTLESSVERLRQYGDNSSQNFKSIPGLITLNQPLFGFNRIRWLRKIEPIKYAAAQKKLISDKEEVAVTVVELYLNLLLGKITLESTLQNQSNSEKLFYIAQARFGMGQLSEVELLQMKNSFLESRSSVIDARAYLESQMFHLRSFLGFDEDVIIKPILPDALAQFGHLDYESVIRMANENNPFTQKIQQRMLEAARNVSQAKAERRDVTLFASIGLSAQDAAFRHVYNSNRWKSDQTVNIGIRFPILDWGKGKSKVRIAEANRDLEISRIEKEQIDFNQNVYLLVQHYNNQPMLLALAKETDENAQKRYTILVDAFIAGKMDILNLNDSQSAKDMARRNYVEQLLLLWSYYYQVRSITLYDFTQDKPLAADYLEQK